MKRVIGRVTAVVALSLALPAQAAEYVMPGPTVSTPLVGSFAGTGNVGTGGFTDNWNFSISQPSAIASFALSYNFAPFIAPITSFGANLYTAGNVLVGSFSGSTANGVTTLVFSNTNLAAGTYKIQVSGTAATPTIYTAGATVTPVPEAHEWAMMLAGLGVVGFVASHKRRGMDSMVGAAA